MILLFSVISTLPTNKLLQIPMRRVSLLSLILVTRDLLDKPTGGVTNTMDKASLGTLLTDDLGGGNLNAGLWWTDADYALRSYVHDCGGP